MFVILTLLVFYFHIFLSLFLLFLLSFEFLKYAYTHFFSISFLVLYPCSLFLVIILKISMCNPEFNSPCYISTFPLSWITTTKKHIKLHYFFALAFSLLLLTCPFTSMMLWTHLTVLLLLFKTVFVNIYSSTYHLWCSSFLPASH